MKQEKPEIDDLTDTLGKMSQNIFAYSFVSEHSKHFFYLKKKLAFLSVEGVDPPPTPRLRLADASAKYTRVFDVLPNYTQPGNGRYGKGVGAPHALDDS